MWVEVRKFAQVGVHGRKVSKVFPSVLENDFFLYLWKDHADHATVRSKSGLFFGLWCGKRRWLEKKREGRIGGEGIAVVLQQCTAGPVWAVEPGRCWVGDTSGGWEAWEVEGGAEGRSVVGVSADEGEAGGVGVWVTR